MRTSALWCILSKTCSSTYLVWSIAPWCDRVAGTICELVLNLTPAFGNDVTTSNGQHEVSPSLRID